ncbi:hypothetical protein BKA81DRAFT_220972 [Phyllosticta paracitricarpa]|uniref:Uncharacterized protein n=1 Tax=Phyllosticta paracitricarpa TaxID=2016321 RepID=A0ABR1N9D6_9PEZI
MCLDDACCIPPLALSPSQMGAFEVLGQMRYRSTHTDRIFAFVGTLGAAKAALASTAFAHCMRRPSMVYTTRCVEISLQSCNRGDTEDQVCYEVPRSCLVPISLSCSVLMLPGCEQHLPALMGGNDPAERVVPTILSRLVHTAAHRIREHCTRHPNSPESSKSLVFILGPEFSPECHRCHHLELEKTRASLLNEMVGL